jgi:hypothetical protein
MRPGGRRQVVGGYDGNDFVAFGEPGPSRAWKYDLCEEDEKQNEVPHKNWARGEFVGRSKSKEELGSSEFQRSSEQGSKDQKVNRSPSFSSGASHNAVRGVNAK